MRRSLMALALAFSVSVIPAFSAPFSQTADIPALLGSIKDASLKRTLENSIKIGLINSVEELNAAIQREETRQNQNSPVHYSARGNSDIGKIRDKISAFTKHIAKSDRDAVEVRKAGNYKGQFLFEDINEEIPASYDACYNLCLKFNPKSKTNDHKRLNKDIDAFLRTIENDPIIVKALKDTNSTIEDLKHNWFGPGLGFEHVIAGEVKGSKVSGYHWWYKFYRDERGGNAHVKNSLSGHGNDKIFTGSFNWDPDKGGHLPNAYKKIGGFINGNSVQSLLAVGHIACEVAKQYGNVPNAMRFSANINGEEFQWQMYAVGNTIRSLYPLGNSKAVFNYEDEEEIAEYYDLEEGAVATVH